ncbi:xanthine dehydrogenase accessory protein XdhC [Sneathiella chinensis]|uniref:Xanthine dehydrogenase accessory protein XdhC n=1 Tax=Sneathiella chinensis TaxID=349750 RepID=A0ABQ5U341_9PROT|nr:xanthine dehydrogenase accessory protein XdhC [Sneathiella chinensis]GLQ06148.1 xanthine dehydrogenase accessory protein XdhC [Sneathiella chinensis]
MSNWRDIIAAHRAGGHCSVLLTVAVVKGSTPREIGARMLITRTGMTGTIGGGSLEYSAIEEARRLLNTPEAAATLLSFPLGPELAQCCGGFVEILAEPLGQENAPWLDRLEQHLDDTAPLVLATRRERNGNISHQFYSTDQTIPSLTPDFAACLSRVSDTCQAARLDGTGTAGDFTLLRPVRDHRFDLFLFGAGHVGQALVKTLSSFPCLIHWVDERPESFPQALPTNVRKILTADPVAVAEEAPNSAFFLVMTHSHQLDLEISAEILKKGPVRYFGLIGSETKRTKFEKRLKLRGIPGDALGKMRCPIGIGVLKGKHPAEIAISTAAEILSVLDQSGTGALDRPDQARSGNGKP